MILFFEPKIEAINLKDFKLIERQLSSKTNHVNTSRVHNIKKFFKMNI